MPKSKNNKTHKKRLARYKANKKREQEAFKQKMIDNYAKMQKEMIDNKEAHTSTQEVSGPDIDIDGLNEIEEWDNNTEVDVDVDVDVDMNVDVTIKNDDNNNK